MKKNNLDLSSDLFTPTRQPLISIVVILYKSFEGIIKQFWFLILIFFFNSKGGGGSNWFLIIGGIGVALISFVFGILRYYNFLYHVDGDHFVITQGLVTKSKTSIPFDRIQSIRMEQKFVHRFLNLYALKIDTAGSAVQEISIPALDQSTAEYLRTYILDRVESVEKPISLDIDGEFATDINESRTEEPIITLSIWDLIKVGLTSNHLKNFFVAFGLVFGLWWQVEQFSGDIEIEDVLDTAQRGIQLDLDSWLIYPLGVIAFIIVSVSISMLFTVIGFFGLKVSKTKKGFRSISGLINKKEHFAPFEKVQIFTWTSNPLRKLIGYFGINIKQAASGDRGTKQPIQIQGAKQADIDIFLNELFPEKEFVNRNYKISRLYIYRNVAFFGLIPGIIFLLGAYFIPENEGFYLYFLAPVWMAAIYFLLDYYYKRWDMLLTPTQIQLERGVFSFKRHRLYLHKIQAINITQSPYQVRKDLASLSLMTAGGPIRIPYLPLSDIEQLADYILFKTENSRRNWM